MNTQQFQKDYSKQNTVLLGQKELRNYPRQDGANPQKTQIGQSTLQQQKGQKMITFLGDSLKDALGITKVKTVSETNFKFTQLIDLIESRVDTQQNKLQQINQDKKSITARQEQEISLASDHLLNCQKRSEDLFNSTFQIFNKSQATLQNKINEIGQIETELATFDRLEKQFDQRTQQINLNCFDSLQDLFNKINHTENHNLKEPNQQSRNQLEQEKNKNPLSQSDPNSFSKNNRYKYEDKEEGNQFNQFEDGGLRFDRWQRGGPEYLSDQSKTYRKTDIDFFFSKVKSDEIHQMYKASQQIKEIKSEFKQNMETEVKQKLHAKRAKLDSLLAFSINQVKEFFLKLPLDYFKKEGEKILKHFKLPAYEDLLKSNLQILPMKVEAFSISLSLEDLKGLQHDQILNENLLEVYALYLRYCHQYLKSKQKQLGNIPEGDILIFSQLFFETQYDGLQIKPQEATTFINNVVPINDLFNSSLINRFGFVINVDLHSIKHWIFFGVFNTTKEIVCYDSAASNSSYFKSISEALKNFFSQVGGGNYTVKKIDNCPRQQNGTDCGMFVMKFIQNFAYGVEQKFTQDNVTALRKKLHTFFPLLSYQFDNNCLDFELLQFYEDTFSIKSESYRRSIGSGLNSI